MDKQYITTSIAKVLEMHGKNYSDYEIEQLTNRWYNAKEPLINILRNHPSWSEQQMAIILSTESSRPLSRSIAHRRHSDINYKHLELFENYIDYPIHNLVRNIIEHEECLMSSEYEEEIKKYIPKFREGTKTTRILDKLYKVVFERIPENATEASKEEFKSFFNKAWAKLADALNPITVTQWTVLSVNPCDYLHMSHGNSWESCHNINDGCYMAGTLSYMCDQSSMIFYTIDGSFNNTEYWREPKITRQVYAYENNMLLQSRLYPDSQDTNTIKNNRQIVQMVMSKVLGVPNLWTLKEDRICAYISTKIDSHHYRDYEYSEYLSTVSILKDEETSSKYIHIGSLAYCLMCGEEIDTHDYLYCDRCKNNEGYVYCEDCGEAIYRENARLIDGSYYCDECCAYCEVCNEYTREETVYVRGLGYVCDYCANNNENVFYCDCCENFHHKSEYDSYVTIGGETICNNCYSRHYNTCPRCGETMLESNMSLKDGTFYCGDCYSELEKENEEVA